MAKCFFIPPHITRNLPLPDRAADVAHDTAIREQRVVLSTPPDTDSRIDIFDAGHRQETTSRTTAHDDSARNANAGLQAVHDLLRRFGIEIPAMTAYVHYGAAYDNAFWDGREMCFGDGDGHLFGDFTAPIDVCAHERQHGVTGNLLAYHDQPGALNESMSDVMGSVTRQQALGLGVHDPASWLIGAGLLLEPGGRAIRDMLHPGTAYDTPALGVDPQPDHMGAYDRTTQDGGGVHINSGIPNRAFALASVAAGDALGPLTSWLTALQSVNDPECSFAAFAQRTVDVTVPSAVRDEIVKAWGVVGVRVSVPAPPTQHQGPPPAPSPAPSPSPTPAPADTTSAKLYAALERLLRSRWVPVYLRRAAEGWMKEHEPSGR